MTAELRAFRDAVRRPEQDFDLGRAAFLIARIEHPDIDLDREIGRLDELATLSGARAAGDHCRAVHRLREFLFQEQGFRGNAEEYFDPRNSCLNDVLDRKLGIPITLSILMIEVGRRVGVSVAGVGLPGHFMVTAKIGEEAVLLDPFNAGSVVSREEAAAVVARALGQAVDLGESHFTPTSKAQIVTRMLANLKGVYIQREDWSKALAVIDRLLLLETTAPVHFRDRGTVLMKLGDFHRGAAEWERYLTKYPHARDAVKLRGQLKRIRQALASLN
jgi:regulator of sirC expression with transglutaminase-like and TPR domain